ncbi:MAG: chemotaxis protein CheW [Mariprofundus sp.]|nr:chemotaxis protein CheW [Mariprofundus sp.]
MDQELLAEFLTESNENMASIEEQLMELEARPQDEELINAIFRVIHTVKGSCGFLGLSGLEKLAHAGENLLGKIRSLKFAVNEDLVSLLLDCADGINDYLQGLEANGAEPALDHSSVISRLQAAERLVDSMAGAGISVVAEAAQTAAIEPSPVQSTPDRDQQAAEKSVAESTAEAGDDEIGVDDWAGDFAEAVRAAMTAKGWHTPEQVIAAGFAPLRDLEAVSPADALKILGLSKKLVAQGGATKKSTETETKNETDSAQSAAAETEAVGVEVMPEQATKTATRNLPAPTKKTVAPAAKAKSAGSIRVDVELLDSLMNQVGELVLTRNRLLQMVQESGSMEFMRVGREVDQVTERLQSQLLRTRMQPIKTIWGSVPRVVRDMSKSLDKRIDVVMEGEETELDRTILTALKDPLTHIIRNSCDHGVEMPAVRRAAGKPEAGTLRLTAAQESGFIVIVVSDDGGGINAEKVKAKALSMGVIDEAMAASMNDQAALQLIFNAGLSTVEKVSNLSGRGVGMDVVKTSIEKVGGSVDISSEMGKGTQLRIRIPLTLAIISAMIVRCCDRRFAIPQISVRELLSARSTSDDWRIIGGHPFFRLRGRLLPILELAETLHLAENVPHDGSIVVMDMGDRTFGILIDEIFGAEEIVVKPLGVHFQQLGHYGGCSILGDGSVIPILDCNGLAQMMDLSEEVDQAALLGNEEHALKASEMQHVLVYKHGVARFAIPMSLVERLERFSADKIELSGGSEVLQYRDEEVIPVLRWGDLIGETRERADASDEKEKDEEGEVYGLILSDGKNRMCLQVDEIVDILEVPLEIKKPAQKEFFLGTTVILEQATEVVEVFDVIKRAVPDWLDQEAEPADQSRRHSILFVEDAAFFRNLVVPSLQAMQCDVWTAEDGVQACRILADKIPDIILTDLEMPNMDGYELARWIAGQERFQGIPVVALTATPPDEKDYERRKMFDEVLLKFDRKTMTETLQLMINRSADNKASLN